MQSLLSILSLVSGVIQTLIPLIILGALHVELRVLEIVLSGAVIVLVKGLEIRIELMVKLDVLGGRTRAEVLRLVAGLQVGVLTMQGRNLLATVHARCYTWTILGEYVDVRLQVLNLLLDLVQLKIVGIFDIGSRLLVLLYN